MGPSRSNSFSRFFNGYLTVHFLLTANSHRSHALGELEHSESRESDSDGPGVAEGVLGVSSSLSEETELDERGACCSFVDDLTTSVDSQAHYDQSHEPVLQLGWCYLVFALSQ